MNPLDRLPWCSCGHASPVAARDTPPWVEEGHYIHASVDICVCGGVVSRTARLGRRAKPDTRPRGHPSE